MDTHQLPGRGDNRLEIRKLHPRGVAPWKRFNFVTRIDLVDRGGERLIFGAQLFDLLAARTFVVDDCISDYAVGTQLSGRSISQRVLGMSISSLVLLFAQRSELPNRT